MVSRHFWIPGIPRAHAQRRPGEGAPANRKVAAPRSRPVSAMINLSAPARSRDVNLSPLRRR